MLFRSGLDVFGVVRAVMFAYTKDIEANLIRELDLLEQIAESRCCTCFLICIREAVDAYLHDENLVARLMLLAQTGRATRAVEGGGDKCFAY